VVRVWDLSLDEPVGSPRLGHGQPIAALACAVINGKPIATTTTRNGFRPDSSAWVWDLATGEPLTHAFGNNTSVYRVVCFELDGQVTLAAEVDERYGQFADSTLRVCSIGEDGAGAVRMLGDRRRKRARTLVSAELNGVPVLLSDAGTDHLKAWYPASGVALNGVHIPCAGAAACATFDGHPVVLTTDSRGRLQAWKLQARGQNLHTVEPLGEPVGPAEGGQVSEITAVAWEGHLIAVTRHRQSFSHYAGDDLDKPGHAHVWDLDLTTGCLISSPLAEFGGVTAADCLVLHGRPVAVLGVGRQLVLWDVTDRRPVQFLPMLATVRAITAVGSSLVVAVGADLLILDPCGDRNGRAPKVTR
jgi:hypothetical protein